MKSKLLIDGLILATATLAFSANSVAAETINNLTSSNSDREILNHSLELIEGLENPELKTKIFINSAKRAAESGDLEKTLDLLKQALESSEEVSQKTAQIFLLLDIAGLYGQVNQFAQVMTILDEVRVKIKQLDDLSLQATFLVELANRYHQINNDETTAEILAEAQTALASVRNPPPDFPFQPSPFDGSVRVGGEIFIAENEFSTLNVRVQGSKLWARNEVDFYVRFVNSFDNSRPSDNQTRILIDAVSDYRYYLSEGNFLFLQIGYLESDFSNTDSRFSYFTGVGFNLFRGDTSKERLDMQLGIGDLVQNSTIKSVENNFPALQYSVIYKDLFLADWEFEQYFVLEFPVRNTPDYFIEAISQVSIPALANWSVFSALSFTYFGITAPDNPNLETRFTTGLEYNF